VAAPTGQRRVATSENDGVVWLARACTAWAQGGAGQRAQQTNPDLRESDYTLLSDARSPGLPERRLDTVPVVLQLGGSTELNDTIDALRSP